MSFQLESPAGDPPAAIATTRRGRVGAGRTGWMRDYVIVGIVVALVVVLATSSDAFLTTRNLTNVLSQWAPVGIIACGATLVIIAGGFDLSVGAVYALTAILAVKLANSLGPAPGILAAVALGAALGILNGAAVTTLRVHSFIATLSSSLVIRGVVVLVTGGTIVMAKHESFRTLGSGEVLSIPTSIYIFAATALLTWFVLARTTLGHRIYAVGGNADAARLAGIRVSLVRTTTFTISGVCAGLAGAIAASRVGSAAPDNGTGLELTAIAAVVIGGTSILGGRGAVWRTVLGVLLLALIGNGFNLLQVDPLYQDITKGLIILLAVAVDAWGRRGEM